MFAVGRYDPRAEDDAKRKKEEEGRRRRGGGAAGQNKRKRRQRDLAQEGGNTATRALEAATEHSAECELSRQHQNREARNDGDYEKGAKLDEPPTGNDGVPAGRTEDGSKSDSSSSVPTSSDESEGEVDNKGPALKVIAPKQKFPSVGGKRRRVGTTDEGLDDFDLDEGGDELSEGRVKDSSVHASPPRTLQQRHHDAEISTALRMSKLPIEEAATIWNLAPFLVSNLVQDGYKQFFPIQSLVIPDVIASERHSQIRTRDVCVSAPTGSGKTLAFVLPVLSALSNRSVLRLRALAVLPSRDLATQVFKVFERYAKGSNLRVGLAIGQTDFEAEQKSLILGSGSSTVSYGDDDAALLRHAFNPTNPRFAVDAYSNISECQRGEHEQHRSVLSTPLGGRSAVDILVATPGRLMDHLDKTSGFTLQHLRFLIIDEADRLVNQSYQNWIGRVTTAASASASASAMFGSNRRQGKIGAWKQDSPQLTKLSRDGTAFAIDPITWRKDMTDDRSSTMSSISRPVPLRKLLFSATLTKDPQKLASLGLVNPKHFDAHHLKASNHDNLESTRHDSRSSLQNQQCYSVPESLSESRIECTAEQKPLVLLALLLQQLTETDNESDQKKPLDESLRSHGDMVVVFTSSVDSTHRLARLLQLLWGAAGYGSMSSIAEFSSALNQKQRSRLLKRCVDDSSRKEKSGDRRISVVICSDGMSRGMDLPYVSAVVNYDVPRYAKTYVHRCGRTARAGKEGNAISLLKGGQVGEFIKMRRLIDDPDRVGVAGVKKDLVRDAIPVYQACVQSLRRVIEAEEEGDLDTVAHLTSDWIPRGSAGREEEGSMHVPAGGGEELEDFIEHKST